MPMSELNLSQERSTCDLMIVPRWLIPVEPEGVVLERHAVAILADKILAIGPFLELHARYAPVELIQLPEHALMPGLVNSHTHAAMSLMRGLADDLPLMRWLSEHVWPAEAKHISRDFVRDGARLAIAEQLRGGVTTMQDMYFFSEVVAQTAAEMGMRAVVGAIVLEFPSAYAANADAYFGLGLALIAQYRNHPLISVSLAPHAPYTVGDKSFARIAQLSADLDVRVHCHIHETAGEVSESVAQFGVRPLARLGKLGLLNSRLSAVHMTQLDETEIQHLSETGVSVLHCPESNLKLASGFCPVQALITAGVNVALGTDGCASNNDLDLLGELKTAALLAKGVAHDATALGAARALTMATLGGAKALGLAAQIGSILAGKQADLVALRFDEFDSLPVYSPISHIVYASHRRQVSDVWVAGQARMRGGLLIDVDTNLLAANARAWGTVIADGGL
jgi:5-methylthioadenosine/S-adenosylhomocysteine deaminase